MADVHGVALRGYRLDDNLEILPGGAALLREDNVVVVSDMHLGCEAVLEYEGLSIPRVQTKKIRSYIEAVVEDVGPRRLVVAGDLKHNFSRNLIQEWNSISEFVSGLADRVSLEVVKGNHDNYLAVILREYGIPLRKETSIGKVRIVHGHEGRLDGRITVLGHIHPSVRLRDRIGASVKDQCFLFDGDRGVLVLPALSVVAGGMDVVHQESADTISPPLSDRGLSRFRPIVYSGQKPLVFPEIGELRKSEGVW